MSYILEALKKAQAERQLGDLPTIHAPVIAHPGNEGNGAALNRPVLLALAGMGVVIAVLLALVLRREVPPSAAVRGPAAAPASAPAGAQTRAPAIPAQAAAPSVAAEQAATTVSATGATANTAATTVYAAGATGATGATAATAVPATATIASSATDATAASAGIASSRSATVAASAPPTSAHLRPRARDEAGDVAAVADRRASVRGSGAIADAPARTAGGGAAPTMRAEAVASREEPIQNQRDLPEPILRAIPPIAMGGYIYSANPADRLLLIDKVLRHEGEEVAPGLVLEKLQPKAAVFSFKGYRYRVPY